MLAHGRGEVCDEVGHREHDDDHADVDVDAVVVQCGELTDQRVGRRLDRADVGHNRPVYVRTAWAQFSCLREPEQSTRGRRPATGDRTVPHVDRCQLLASVRVLDVGGAESDGVGRLLADLGADVLKIEPPGGAADRTTGASVFGTGIQFALSNANKRCATLDAGDRDRFIDLAGGADIVDRRRGPRAGPRRSARRAPNSPTGSPNSSRCR